MVVPRPFSRAIFLYGPPILIPRDGNVEEWRQRVEDSMNALADEAEANFDELWSGDPRPAIRDDSSS
jgi:lysophospholipid acyltransferase (LPLAT)-like uncharacterized protein